MNLPNFCIKRPAFTIVISLVLVIVGLIGFMNSPVRWIPNVNLPQVYIYTYYKGANARLVERDITKVLEDSLAGINGIESLSSVSKQGQSAIYVTFKLGQNMNAAVEEIRTNVERYRGSLPRDAENPVVMKADPDSNPIMYITFFDPNFSSMALSDYIQKYIKPAFETIDGIGNAWIFGERLPAMRIQLDPNKMAAAKVTADEVIKLLQEQNLSIPSGQIQSSDRFYSVITDTNLKTERDFNNLIIRSSQNNVLRLKDIGHAEIAPETEDSTFRINGHPAVALGIVPQSTANPIDIEKQVRKVLKGLKKTLPKEMTVSIPFNSVEYIRSSMTSVYEAFIEAIIFVWLVIFFFLNSFRATLIPIITIPVCLISSFALIYFMGFSINTITLMALVLAIGLVVDDAIVMLENIKRHLDTGLKPFAAAMKGSTEIVFPIIAMTLTLAAVYAPIAFTPGLLGVLFKEFTFTLAGAVIISGVVALTLSPMMCGKLLLEAKEAKKGSRFGAWIKRSLDSLQQNYSRLLTFILAKRVWVIVALAVFIAMGAVVYKYSASELAPDEDMSEIDVSVIAPRSASYTYTDNYVKQLEAIYKQIPDISSYITIINNKSPSHSFHMIKLKKEHKLSTAALVDLLKEKARFIQGVKVNVFTPSPALTEVTNLDEGSRLGLIIMTSGDYRKLQQISAAMKDKLSAVPGFENIVTRLRWDSEQFQVNIDREKSADLKVSLPDITNTISTLIAGKTIGKVDEANIIVQMNKNALADPNIFQQLYVRNSNGEMIGLGNLISMKESTAPEVFHHNERLRADVLYASAPSLKLADAVKILQKIARDTVPDNMKYNFTGEAKSYLDSSGKMTVTFLLALVFIYLVLVAQFESFISPLIILFTVPFALIGAIFSLKVFGGSLNIYSNIGLITLVGLIAKHGILITEFANRQRERGEDIYRAVIQAAILRLRPILMTTAAMVLGALPLALAFGPGSESRQQIGLVITGGLLIGTFFSLIVVPVVYTYLAPFIKVGTDEEVALEDT